MRDRQDLPANNPRERSMQYQKRLPVAALIGSALGERLVRPSGSAQASSRTQSSDWLAWIASLLGRLSSRVLRERKIERARAALYALDDRTLKDIGISRHEIDLVARHGRPRR
jgi:uncharacterized protein YjiS (DUF1127 family)